MELSYGTVITMRTQTKLAAIQLRKLGRSYGEIASLLNVPSKGTLSHWLNGVILNEKAVARIKRKTEKNLVKARIAAQKKSKELREQVLEVIRKNALMVKKGVDGNINSLKLALAFLYLGEGSKWKSHSGLQLGSSDPEIVELYIQLLEKCYRIDRKSLHCYICHRADQNLVTLQRFWSRKIHIPLKNFYKSIPDKRTIGKPTKNKNYKGVCVVSGGSSKIQLELEMIPRVVMGL